MKECKVEGITQYPAAVASLPLGNCSQRAEVDRFVVDLRSYFVCPDVHLAFMDDCTVMLQCGIYKIFWTAETKALALGVRSWPKPGAESLLSARQSEFLQTLAAQGVLTQDSGLGRPATAVTMDAPARSLLDHELDWVRPTITGAHIRRFYRAILAARMRQLQRPLDSLGLVEFLALNGADISRMRWVVGVRVRPWGAHCWFQQQELVVNDTCERVKQFVPILVA